MQILIPRTHLVKSLLFSCVLFVVFFRPPLWIFTGTLTTKTALSSETEIVFHCADWVTDTLPSYDLDFVLNNPRTIGNPDTVASPQAASQFPQTISNADWSIKNGAGPCNLEIKNLATDSIRNLGFLYASVKGGADNCQMSLSWRDSVTYTTCQELQNGGIYARIYRKWSATCSGVKRDTVQVILFKRPASNEFLFNTNGEEIGSIGYDRVVTYNACSGDKSLIQKEDVTPYTNSYFTTTTTPRLAFIDETRGKYGIQLKDIEFPTCGSRGVKIDRRIYVFDSCQGKFIDTFRVLIKIGDYQGPKFIKTKELPEIYINSSDGKAVFGLNRSEFATRFGVIIEECLLGNISARFKVKDRYVGGVLVAENVWDEVPNATPTIYDRASVPPGHYKIYCNTFDGCFNYSQDSFEFLVKNEIGPLPICVNRMSVDSLLPDGQGGGTFTLKATDFVGGPIYDLNGQGPDTMGGKKLITHYSINRFGQPADSSQKEIKLTCFDANKTIMVELHAWDKNGRDGFCTTFVEVQNKNKVCFDEFGFRISGQVSTEDMMGVQDITINLSGLHNSDITNTKTTKTGSYTLENLKRDEGHRLTPKSDENPLNGVSTYDILLIQKHILNIEVLNSPYKMIAADVNNSRSISAMDIIQLRKLILRIDKKFINNRSWRFVSTSYTFPNRLNPWLQSFPEYIFIASWLPGQSTDFVAIKIGDVNASAKLNGEE